MGPLPEVSGAIAPAIYLAGVGLSALFGGLFGHKGAKAQSKAAVESAKIQSTSTTEAAKLETEASTKAAELAAAAEEAKLKYQREVEATRKAEWQAVQDKNYAEYMAREGRLDPYRQTGAAALGRLNTRMGGGGTPGGTLGGLMTSKPYVPATYTPGAATATVTAPTGAAATAPRPVAPAENFVYDARGQVVGVRAPDGTIRPVTRQSMLQRRGSETLGALMR